MVARTFAAAQIKRVWLMKDLVYSHRGISWVVARLLPCTGTHTSERQKRNCPVTLAIFAP